MTYDLTPYPTYKRSSAPWLDKTPEHWDELPAFAGYAPKLVRNVGLREKTVLSLSFGRIVVKPEEKLHGLVPESFEGYQIVEPGDIIVRTTDLQNDRTSLRVGMSQNHGIITSAYMCLRARSILTPTYAYQLLNAYDQLKVLYGFGSGLRQNLEFRHIKRMPVPIPPPADQDAIVHYLEYADGRIKRYIAAKRKLIAVLNEQKQGIAEKAVTRGLHSSVSLKPSGVAWLGNVPDRWEVVRFKLRVGFQEGPGIMAADFRDVGTPLLRISCLEGERASLRGCNFLDPETVRRRWSHFAVRDGDYLLSASASTGSVVLATREVAGAIPYTGIIRLWPLSSKAFMPFVRLFMGSRPFQEQIEAAKSGVAISHFGPTHLKRMFMCLPPRDEQETIVQYVENATAGIVDAIDRTRREISLVLEYRTRLIADVVTGKLDVREASSQLPKDQSEFQPEPDDLDEADAELVDGAEPVAEETEA